MQSRSASFLEMPRVVMLQGTGSGVGKSLLAAGLCRWLANRDFRVRPFKAQNMALNSGVTPDGKEIGRAQVLQAEACRVAPDVRMNPVLLKPQGPGVSQLVRMGEAIRVCSAQEYYTLAEENFRIVQEAFAALKTEADWIIIEGAGSPAEINLQATDIVNMRMAEHAQARVIVVGDIDRGGVFAWFKGTYDLVQDRHRPLIQGFLINKFRGDVSLLQPGIEQFAEHVPVPVLGVIPWREFALEDEDSQNLRSRLVPDARLEIAVIRIPYLSNFTDFDPLKQIPGISVRFTRNPDDLASANLIILPGSKNTAHDLRFLNDSGLADELRRLHGRTWILGVCGGYQMLGTAIEDPDGIESENPPASLPPFAKEKIPPTSPSPLWQGDRGGISGLGILSFRTRMASQKTLVQREYSGSGWLDGIHWPAYEIHHGRTEFVTSEEKSGASSFVADAPDLGMIDVENRVFGTYLHGFFDTPEVVQKVLALLTPEPFELPPAFHDLKERELDALADFLDEHCDVPRLLGMNTPGG